jgi:antitoxin component YwqK of YwqJK toxin-antitoxin module
VHTQYYADGKPRHEYTIPHNPNGEKIEKDFAESGNLRFERRYENGRQVSEKQYFDNGKLRRALQRNADGRLVTVEEYDESGKKIN